MDAQDGYNGGELIVIGCGVGLFQWFGSFKIDVVFARRQEA